jgi:hypothetical protein
LIKSVTKAITEIIIAMPTSKTTMTRAFDGKPKDEIELTINACQVTLGRKGEE